MPKNQRNRRVKDNSMFAIFCFDHGVCFLLNKNHHHHGKSSFQQEEDSLHQQIGLKFKELTSNVLHLEHSILWC